MHEGSVPSNEVEVTGVASAAQEIGPGLAQLEDCDRARRDGLQRAPISAGVRVRSTIVRRAMGFAKNLPPPIFVGNMDRFVISISISKANAWVC